MHENITPYELAVKLREKDFNEPCYHYYQEGEIATHECWNCYNFGTEKIVSAPTIPQVIEWLREKQNIHIGIDLWENGWYANILHFAPEEDEEGVSFRLSRKYQSDDYGAPGEATLDGIKYALNNLI